MDPVAFFNTILPTTGLRVMAVPAGSGFRHIWLEDNAKLATFTANADVGKGLNVYYGCASFKKDGTRNDKGFLERKQHNVAAVRSFWCDLDVGPDKPYATPREAAQSIIMFVAKVGLPKPYLVSSGGGVHVYWPMDADMAPDIWKVTATLLKAALTAEGVGQDPSRTSDEASVLRPPGTHNRKTTPRPVRVILPGDVGKLTDFQQALLPYSQYVTQPETDTLGAVPDYIRQMLPGDASDLDAGVERRPSSAARAANQCGVLARIRDSQGNVDQPTWFFGLGVLAFTDDGAELAHAWSKGHPSYSPDETNTKLAQVSKVGKPTTCAKLAEHNPTICGACPHKVKTPWTLGQYDVAEVRPTVETVVSTPTGFITQAVETDLPDGFRIEMVDGRKQMKHITSEQDDKGNTTWDWEVFCETPFYAINRLWIENAVHIEMEMILPNNGGKRRWTVEGATIAKGKDTLAASLGQQEIVPLNGKERVVDSYMKRYMNLLTRTAVLRVAFQRFGWNEDRSFVLGDCVLHPGGGETRPILVKMAKSLSPHIQSKGSLQTWIETVDRAYNADGQEAFQFIVCCGFAAPLLSMMNQVSGVTVFAHSEGSGVGKTTAQKVALSVFGNWEEMMLAQGKATPNAMWATIGAYSNLPVVYDELTNQSNEEASELVFSVSSGRAKKRLNAESELKENNNNWKTILLASGNNLLSEKLSLNRGNSEAEMSRLFEFTLRAKPHLTPNEANALFPKLLSNYGVAGKAFMRYVVDNYELVEAMLFNTQAKLNARLNITQVERYWSALFATVLVALTICRNLGLLQFDVASLTSWMIARLGENRVQRNEAASDPKELFGSMLSDLWQGILVTYGEGDIRKGQTAEVVEGARPRGALVGRAILASSKDPNSKPVLLLSRQAVKDWANKKGVSAREMFDEVVRAGWCDPNHVRYSLGKGTVEYAQTSSYIPCWKLDPDRIMGADGGKLVSQKLASINGGQSHVAGAATT